MVGNGRSTGWNFTPVKFNFFASSCPKKRDRASRKDWISNLGVGDGGAGETMVDTVRIVVRGFARTQAVEVRREHVRTNGRGLFPLKERKMRIPCAEAELLNIKVSKFRGASKVHSKT